ncbi:MAG: phosphoribosylformylglycinamidine synthase, partial [Candidatus Sungbacteria bacterium]|nr:phosphoribosylformylglycinamidine synthase [Candidatus Sungbacteria bacterium]
VCDLDMEFLHHGLPQRVLHARWSMPTLEEPFLSLPDNWTETYAQVLAHGNVCSKEPIVRLYDHGVQGTNVLPPFSGVGNDGPNDAVVLTPILGKPYGVVISHGLNPVLNRIDPYWGGIWAATEALANLVAVGGNPEKAWLIDNFIWPFPDEEALGALDRAVDACVDVSQAFGIPFVSGKDSLSSTYSGKDGTIIKIPPVLCISAFGNIPDVAKTITADFKEAGSVIMLLGLLNPLAMGGSVYFETCGVTGANLPQVDLQRSALVFRTLHALIQRGLILACHDVSEGGVLAALAEMCFGGNVGASIDTFGLGEGRADYLLFNEMAGCFIAEVRLEDVCDILFSGVHANVLGSTHSDAFVRAAQRGEHLFTASLADLKAAWQKPMQEVFH